MDLLISLRGCRFSLGNSSNPLKPRGNRPWFEGCEKAQQNNFVEEVISQEIHIGVHVFHLRHSGYIQAYLGYVTSKLHSYTPGQSMVNHIRRAVYLAMRLLYITNSNSLLRE
jgi:hypothetical protein